MGAGKTTIGREIARRRGIPFFDSDHEIVARTGVSIPNIFAVEGEAGFRRRESEMLDELTGKAEVVIATGGGVVLDPDSRALMARRGIVVYLDVPPYILWERIRNDRNRPLLNVERPRQRIETLYRERDPLYREVADIIVGGGRSYPGAMVRQIEQALSTFKKSSCVS